jgi:hypothetical protein
MRLPTTQNMNQTKSTLEWNEEVGHQLSQFKQHQSSKLLPKPNKDIKQGVSRTQFLKRIESQQVFSSKHPQFSELNCEPYRRDGGGRMDMNSTISQLSSL